MNLFQRISLSAAFLSIGGCATGIVVALNNDKYEAVFVSPSFYLYVLFVILFRVKQLLDDHKYFGEPYVDKNNYRYASFLIAIFAWLFYAIGAALVANLERSIELIGFSIFVSTIWLIVHVIEIAMDPNRRKLEESISLMREKWAVINLIYMICIVCYVGWLRPVIPKYNVISLIALIIVFVYEFLTGRSYKNILAG